MWLNTAKNEYVNLDNVDMILVEGKSVIAKAGQQKITLYAGASETVAAEAHKIVCEGIARGFKQINVDNEMKRIADDEVRKKEAVAAAKKRDEEIRSRSEAKLMKPITDKKE